VVLLVNNISEELLSPSSHQQEVLLRAGNNLWYYTMLQLRRNHRACLWRNLHFHKGIILNQLQIRCYGQSIYLLEVTILLINKQLMKQLQTGCVMAQEASWQPLTTEARMQSQANPYGKCGS
jgi:hypothetical protein